MQFLDGWRVHHRRSSQRGRGQRSRFRATRSCRWHSSHRFVSRFVDGRGGSLRPLRLGLRPQSRQWRRGLRCRRECETRPLCHQGWAGGAVRARHSPALRPGRSVLRVHQLSARQVPAGLSRQKEIRRTLTRTRAADQRVRKQQG